MKYIAWRDINRLPLNDKNDWSVFSNGKYRISDEEEVQRTTSSWMPSSPVLVGNKHSKHMMPPVMFPMFEESIIRRLQKYYRMLFIACLLPALVLALLWVASDKQFPLSSIAFVLLALVMGTEYFIFRSLLGVSEWALFFFWLKNDKSVKLIFLSYTLFGVLIYAFQLYFQNKLGGFEQLMHSYGLMYQPTKSGDFWRLITGPYFHYSVLHFALNFANLLFIGTIATRFFGYRAILVFILGNIVSGFSQMTFGGQLFDNYGGISGGVYSLFGLLIYRGFSDKALLPTGFNIVCFELFLLGVLVPALLSPNSALVAHIAGFLFGSLCGVVFFGFKYEMKN